MVERVLFDKPAQLVHVGLGFTRKTDDEGRAKGDVGHPRPNPRQGGGRTSRGFPGRFMRARTGFDACCSGRSMYLQTFSHSAIAASVSSSIVVG